MPMASGLRLNMRPEEALSSQVISSPKDWERAQDRLQELAGCSYPYINCWSFHISLAFMVFDGKGTAARSKLLSADELAALGITEEELQEAFSEAGGSLNFSGHYPINQSIKDKLQAGLGVAPERMQEAF